MKDQPDQNAAARAKARAKADREAKHRRSIELNKATSHPLRLAILGALEEGSASSPNGLSAHLGEPLGNVSYHVKTLLEFGCVELVKTEPRRGAVEHYYRSTGAVVLPGADLSASQRELTAAVLARSLRNGLADEVGLTPIQLRELADAQVLLEQQAATA